MSAIGIRAVQANRRVVARRGISDAVLHHRHIRPPKPWRNAVEVHAIHAALSVQIPIGAQERGRDVKRLIQAARRDGHGPQAAVPRGAGHTVVADIHVVGVLRIKKHHRPGAQNGVFDAPARFGPDGDVPCRHAAARHRVAVAHGVFLGEHLHGRRINAFQLKQSNGLVIHGKGLPIAAVDEHIGPAGFHQITPSSP